jgi:hypothetical protein
MNPTHLSIFISSIFCITSTSIHARPIGLPTPAVFQEHHLSHPSNVTVTEVVNETDKPIIFDQRGEQTLDITVAPHEHYVVNRMVPQSGFFSVAQQQDTWLKRVLFVWAKENTGICQDAQGKKCVIPFGLGHNQRKLLIRVTEQGARIEEVEVTNNA